MLRPVRCLLALFLLVLPGLAGAQSAPPPGGKWVAVWTGSAHGPYPVGNPTAQPEMKFAFPSPETGANDQSFRMIVRPDLWGPRFRLRFSNAFGTRPVTFDGVHLGVQAAAGALVRGTNRAVAFDGKREITVEPGKIAYSDPVELDFIGAMPDATLSGRKLAVSFHVVGTSGKMTWHAKALQTSYASAPGAGAHSLEEGDAAFPYSTTSWYFLDAVELMAPAGTTVVVAFRD
jgi:hypothetical protein